VNGTQQDGALRDGGAHRLRAARESDGDALGQFVSRLSLQSRYFRFFAGVPRLTPAMVRRMTGTRAAAGEYVDALVAVGDGGIIGHGMATDNRNADGTAVTEIGVVVADEWQHHGVGSALTRALATRAQARGATVLIMDVLAENQRMLTLITHRFPAARSSHAGSCVTVHVPLPLTQEDRPRECRVRQPQLAGTG
jgi:acetyltransferase